MDNYGETQRAGRRIKPLLNTGSRAAENHSCEHTWQGCVLQQARAHDSASVAVVIFTRPTMFGPLT